VIAISLGARLHVANLIGVQNMRRRFDLGQHVRVAGFEGRILEFASQAVVLETEDGRVSVPGRVFSEQPVTLLTRNARDG
jgi:RNase P/RNase MRP subunit p29